MQKSLLAWWGAPDTRAARPLSALAWAAAAILAGCAPRHSVPTGPAPTTEAVELGEGKEILGERVATARRDLLGDVAYDLPVEANSWVESELDFLVGQRRDVIGRWIERGDYYEEFIKQVLRSNGLPTDLFHLAMIESGFQPTVRSRAGAVGMWQFMPSTGRALGLRIDTLVDERMDPVRSTRAAARHLRSVYQEMGSDWALAAASYNAGTGRISRGIARFGVSNFWDLAQQGDLAQETKVYVPRLYAMTVITRGRERFGFPARSTAAGFQYDSINVEYATPLSELARMGTASGEQLARLNPHLLRGTTPEGGYWVWVPAGAGEPLQRAYLASDFRKHQGLGSYTVRHGDHLAKLADLAGVPTSRIRELNPKADFDNLKSGQKLAFPALAARQLAARPRDKEEKAYLSAPSSEQKAKKSGKPESEKAKEAEKPVKETKLAKPETEPAAGKSHVVKEGETLWAVAQRFGVEVAALRRANDLSGDVIRPGQKLAIPAGKQTEKSETAVSAAAKKTTKHVVKNGESLWGLARRYGSSVEAIQAANHLSDGPLLPGQQLVIPAGE